MDGPRAHILTTVSNIKKHRKMYSARSENDKLFKNLHIYTYIVSSALLISNSHQFIIFYNRKSGSYEGNEVAGFFVFSQ